MTESAQNADFRRKPQIFADSPLVLKIPAFGGRRKPQKTADFRRKPKIFAENRRKPQIGLRHLRSVTFSSALSPANSPDPNPGKRSTQKISPKCHAESHDTFKLAKKSGEQLHSALLQGSCSDSLCLFRGNLNGKIKGTNGAKFSVFRRFSLILADLRFSWELQHFGGANIHGKLQETTEFRRETSVPFSCPF